MNSESPDQPKGTLVPYVTVYFDPSKIRQFTLNALKPRLQLFTAAALSSKETLPEGSTHDISVDPSEVCVRQEPFHPTDIHPTPIAVVIQAGRRCGRDAEMVCELIRMMAFFNPKSEEEGLRKENSSVWIIFNEENAFQITPKR